MAQEGYDFIDEGDDYKGKINFDKYLKQCFIRRYFDFVVCSVISGIVEEHMDYGSIDYLELNSDASQDVVMLQGCFSFYT